jgi:hypothetical protein
MANGVEVDVPVTSSEAHLDLLLAEELAVNQQFLRRLIEPARALTGTDPVSDVVTAVVRLNVWDDGGPSCVATDGGENDIDVAVTIGSHTMRVLIEDKVWAVFQPDQCERYRRRADSRGDTAVLVAPKSRLNHGTHTHCFHVTYAIRRVGQRSRHARSRLIVYPPRRCGSVRSVERSWRWLTNRLPVVRGLASERGASRQGFAVAWLERGVNAGPAVAEIRHADHGPLPHEEER